MDVVFGVLTQDIEISISLGKQMEAQWWDTAIWRENTWEEQGKMENNAKKTNGEKENKEHWEKDRTVGYHESKIKNILEWKKTNAVRERGDARCKIWGIKDMSWIS